MRNQGVGEEIRPDRVQQPGPESPRKGTFWIVPLVGVGCILVLILATMLRDPIPGTILTESPPEVVGRWVTSDSQYVDRGLRIGAHDIVMDVGPDRPPLHGDILMVSVREEDQKSVVYFEYDTGEGPMVMEMILDGNDRMHLRNPPGVTWTRVR